MNKFVGTLAINYAIFPIFFSGILLGFAWLIPPYSYPWSTFSSEFLSFIAGIILLIAMLFQDIKIPKIQLWMLFIVIVPVVQWFMGVIDDFSIAFLALIYLLGFWLMIIAGFNLALLPKQRELLMFGFSNLVFKVAIISSLMAILQWLNLEFYAYGIMQLNGNRPYANFGQPNNLATFLIIGLLGGLYLYETTNIPVKKLIICSVIILIGIALTQSRTSWLVFIFIIAYFLYKKPLSLSFNKLFLWAGGYFILASYLLPSISKWIMRNFFGRITHTASILERASSGHERIGMWLQILHAIIERPWFGYGWNQTSVAVVESIHFNTVQIWFNSAHNILLDILVWNGIPIGLFIIMSIAVWLFWLSKNINDIISVIAILMTSAVIIHAMFEFPQRYAYFLLPTGFLLGIVQAQTPNLKFITINKRIFCCVLFGFVILLLLVWRDCKFLQKNSQFIFRYESASIAFLGSNRVLFLTKFQKNLEWIEMSPRTKLSDHELNQIGYMVKNEATQYNLKKYAQILKYNGKIHNANEQLIILKKLYNQEENLDDLDILQ
ncbi:pilin glycosylation ligase domain-containing protein [Acinetobacter junii]|uniref:PglL family O-oligosaccharyltransferase n=1 Tax=Acinetobacter junii TaxID=40215 RepID=UPI000F67D48C|nr:O-antigen ligase family protein [Acinetobacter junii]RSE33714.1 O-antigen ligase family protein [Acinetobacter junii]